MRLRTTTLNTQEWTITMMTRKAPGGELLRLRSGCPIICQFVFHVENECKPMVELV